MPTVLRSSDPVQITDPTTGLTGELVQAENPVAVVLMAHGQRARRLDSRNRHAAQALAQEGMAVFAFDLLNDREAHDPAKPFQIDLLTERFVTAIRWAKRQPGLRGLPVGLLAIHTGAAAAIRAAGVEHDVVRAVVCRGGRPDLAGDEGLDCDAPVLYLVGGRDDRLLGINAASLIRFGSKRRLEIIEQATHFFEEPGAFEAATSLATSWFLEHLVRPGTMVAGVHIKRAYDPPSPEDGRRILIDRLWPRGVSKQRAHLDLWLKEAAPSAELRRWFGHRPERWTEFRARYREELSFNPAVKDLRQMAASGPITLVYGAKDREHNDAVVLAQHLMTEP